MNHTSDVSQTSLTRGLALLGKLPGWRSWATPVAIAALLIMVSFQNFLLFHTLAEFFAITVGMLMCVVAWQTYSFSRNNFLMFLASGYFWIAVLDGAHALAYKGMGILPASSANLSIQLWISTRFSEALLLLAAPLFLTRDINRRMAFALFGLVAVGICALIGYGYFPDSFIEGQGLTRFKINSEYVIIAILVASLAHIWRRRRLIEDEILVLLVTAIVLTMGAELAFTYYVSVYGLSNLVGHTFKLFSFWLLFMAVIRTTLIQPYIALKDENVTSERAESELRESEARLADAQRIAHMGNWEWDIPTGDLIWSDEIYRIFGLGPEKSEVSYETFLEILHPEDRDFVAERVKQAMKEQEGYYIDYRILLPDGTIRFLNSQGEVTRDDEGRAICMHGIIMDITGRKAAETALRESEEHLAATLGSVVEGIISIDEQGIVENLNPAAQELFQYATEEIIGQNINMLMPEPDRSAHDGYLKKYRSTGKALIIGSVREVMGRRKDGTTFPLELRVSEARQRGRRFFVGALQDITRRKADEKELQKREAMLSNAQRIGHMGNWEWNILTGDLSWSEEIFRIFGFQPEEFAASYDAFLNSVHPDDRDFVVERVERAVQGKEEYNIDHRILLPDGTVRVVNEQGEVTRDDDGRAVHMSGIVLDITERKAADKALRDSEAMLNNAQRIAHVGNFDWEPNDDILIWSDEAFRIFGLEPQKVKINYDVFMEIVHPDDREFVAESIKQALEGAPYNIDHRVVLQDGTVRTVNEQAEVSWDEDGRPVMVSGVMRDITERRAAEKALRDSEEQVRLLLNSTSEAIYGIDLEGDCTFANPACAELLGYDDPAALLSRNMHELIHHTRADGTNYPSTECNIYQAYRRGKGTKVDDEVFWRADGSSFPALYRSVPIVHDGETIGAVITFEDLTESRQAEKSAHQLRDQLAHAARLSTMGNMATGLAHEINQPLTAINSYAQASIRLLSSGKGKPDEVVADLEKVTQQVSRAADIINWLRDSVRKEEIVHQALDITDCIKEVRQYMLAEIQAKNSQLDLDLAIGLPDISASRVQIQQVLINLLQNSLQAGERASTKRHRMTIRASCETEGILRVEVEDNGPGVPDEILDDLFDSFSTTKDEGLGLGLSISSSIIEDHGGRLWINKDFRQGASFVFVLPIVAETK